jgi:hypothetical protein
LLPALQAALRTLGDTPARSLSALAQRLEVSEADAVSLVESLEEAPPSVEPISSPDAAGEASPPFAHDGVPAVIDRKFTVSSN